MPKISVIIPCYNQGKYVNDAVDSILAQTFQDFEIIIINDGSTDEFTNALLNNYHKPKTKVIHTINQGLAAARNNGIRSSGGEYIQLLDSDDLIDKNKFKEQLEIFESNSKIDVCYTNFRTFKNNTKEIGNRYADPNLSTNQAHDFLIKWDNGLSIPIHCALFKRSVLKNDPFNECLKAKEDWVMWCNIAIHGVNFYFLDKDYAFYRMHTNNMCKDKKQMFLDLFKAIYYLSEIVPIELKNEFYKANIIRIENSLNDVLNNERINAIEDIQKEISNLNKSKSYRLGKFILKPFKIFKRILNA